jgi:hypothetical protein
MLPHPKFITMCKNTSVGIGNLEIKPTRQPKYISLSIDMLIEDYFMNDDDKN